MKKVKITRLSNKGQYPMHWFTSVDKFSKPDTEVNRTIKPVPKNEANVEAEKGETIIADMNFDNIPENYNIGGKKHYDGGTPLNVPDDSFVFSDTSKMKIKDKNILKMFNKPEKGKGFTPAEISKAYDINSFSKVLADKDSDDLQRKTAEAMISNYNLKLGKLALVQESMKGFPTGIPKVAMPYIEENSINPADFFYTQSQQDQPGSDMYKYGGGVSRESSRIHPPTPKVFYNIDIPILLKDGGSYNSGGEYDYDAPIYQKGGDVSGQTIVDINDPNLKVGDVVRGSDGKLRKIKSLPVRTNYSDERLGSLQNEYGYLQQTLNDPDIQDQVYNNYQEHIKSSGLSESRKATLLSKPKKDVIDNFLTAQKQVYALHNKGVDLTSPSARKWDTGTKNSVYKNSMKNMGFKDDELLNDDQIAMFQAAYKGLVDTSQDPNYKSKLDKFGIVTQAGMQDEAAFRGNRGISPVDDWFGNTTAGQAFLPQNLGPELEDIKPVAGKSSTNKAAAPLKTAAPTNDKWWLQDIIKTAGAAGDFFRVKKYNPWQATPDYVLPDPTFYDPTRELAANAEQMNIISQGLSTFGNPQSYIANMSAVSGNASKNSADILGRYNNLNVGVANQFEQTNSDIINQNSAQKAALATQLYDKYTIANQQFDNSKNMARQNLRQSYIDAVTNKNYTANLNDLYPQYNIDPLSGGRIRFTNGQPLDPSMSSNNDVMAQAQEYLQMYPSFDPKTAYEAAKMRVSGNSRSNIPPDEYLEMLNGMR